MNRHDPDSNLTRPSLGKYRRREPADHGRRDGWRTDQEGLDLATADHLADAAGAQAGGFLLIAVLSAPRSVSRPGRAAAAEATGGDLLAQVDDTIAVGFGWGFAGILAFSLSLPATRVAVPELGWMVVGLGRAVVAAAIATLLLWVRHEPFPD